MSAPVQSLQPGIDLVQDLRMDADMLKNGHQQNLTKLWHSDVVKQAALNALKAANTIEQYRADQTRDESVIATLKARAEQAERAVDVQAKLLADTGRRVEELEAIARQSRDAMLATRTASIAGCEEGYGKPEKWAEELFCSHGGLTAAIKAIDAALESKP